MDKGSFFYLLLFSAITLLAIYNALFPLSASTVFIRFLGLAGFLLLCVSLIMGPLAIISPKDFAILLVHRRAIGIISFVVIFAHLFLSFWLQFNWDILGSLSQLPVLEGSVAAVILVALTATSTDWAIKNIKQWKNIQRLAYVAFAFSFLHFITRANGLFLGLGQGRTFVNFAEIAMIALGIATIALQLWGYVIVAKRKSVAAQVPAQPAAPPSVPVQQQPAQEEQKQN